jgi:tyrosyl-tRNA synthetase
MSKFASEFLNILSERGFIHQCSDYEGLDALAAKKGIIGYIGFDCTAPSLHIGSLVQIMLLYWAQQTGQKPIALMGGGTTRVGDPSGRDESRRLLTIEEIEANKRGIQDVFARFLHFGDGPGDAVMVDNAEWLTRLNYIDMLREVGRHFSVNRMLTMDSVKLRLERDQELSFIEFNYMVLQAYDFVELARRYGCNLQMGGSDQWGNIVTGIDLGRRMGTHQLYALTSPLITTSSGAKMGKTAAGAIWLNAGMRSPYEYWQFWRNTEDADVGRFLKLFTTLPLGEIARLESLGGAEINEAKKVLANEATKMVHGTEAAREAAETARKTFEEGTTVLTLPSIDVPRSEIDAGFGVLSAFVRAGLAASNSEVRRAIANNAVQVNGERITDDTRMITGADVTAAGVVKLSMGRKKHVLLRPQ